MKARWSCGAEFEAPGEIPDLWNTTRPRVPQRQVKLGCEVTGSRHVPLYGLGGAPLEFWLDSTGWKWAGIPRSRRWWWWRVEVGEGSPSLFL